MRKEIKEARKERIILSAMAVFRRYGYRKSSLEDIAREAGMGKATLYNYALGKEQIFGEVVLRFYNEYIERLREELAMESTPIGRLRRYAEVLLDQHRQTVDVYTRPHGDEEAQLPLVIKYVSKFRQMELDMLRDILTSGIEQGMFRRMDADLAASLLFAVFRGMIASATREPSREAEIVGQFTAILFEGLLRGDRTVEERE